MDSPSPRRCCRHHHHHNNHGSPRSSASSTNSNGLLNQRTRSEAGSPTPTTFVQADRNNFKHVVQMLTGCNDTIAAAKQHHIPPMKTIPNKKQQHQSGFKLYERRNHILNLNPLLPTPPSPTPNHHFHRHQELLSPSILDFPSLVLSPVTPLIPDPFARSSTPIKDKPFFLHPSPATTPREAPPQPQPQPRLLPLFPTSASPSSP
ncbi:hypothetical protein PIB30_028900 [Stylosanthes scabra]|uniref:VQ domain-containing protein n=1 Tax=Stylosanthes scabra TaxID=79078 RepID=A0ABU6Y898_9FABA|nr:hypothetical protein [Stylosanthes scabra]